MQTTHTRRARTRGRNSYKSRSNDRQERRPRSRHANHRHAAPARRSKRVLPTFDPTQFINTNPVEVIDEVYAPEHTFNDFKIDTKLKKTIEDMGLVTPSPIQDQVIPLILEGEDVVGLAETGTGKTAAFLIPLIERKKSHRHEVTLIMTPTRELAIQVDNEFKKLAKDFHLYSTVCVGGVGIGGQIKQLRKTNQFIIGTPGRLKDLIARNSIKTNQITSVVLDEADRMLDMGFIHDMRTILSDLPNRNHTLFFSATMDDKTKALVHDFMNNPKTVSVKKKDVTNSIMQDVVRFEHDHKFETLVSMLKKDEYRRVIIFGAMKHSVEKLSKELTRNGVEAESIHGNKSHGQRQRSLSRFKSGQVKVLVATDVAARGIHVDNVSHVINYDLPGTFEDYVHRIGRTGRGKSRGIALTFVPNK